MWSGRVPPAVARRRDANRVVGGIAETVGVIEPETVDPPLPREGEDLRVRLGEDLGELHPDRHEGVDVEEAAVG